MGDAERLSPINPFFHPRNAWRTDAEVWGIDDFRATPLETLDKRQGDCEDCAIAKYASLLVIGTAPDRLCLAYLRATMPRQAAALALEVLSGPRLDRTARRRTRIQP